MTLQPKLSTGLTGPRPLGGSPLDVYSELKNVKLEAMAAYHNTGSADVELEPRQQRAAMAWWLVHHARVEAVYRAVLRALRVANVAAATKIHISQLALIPNPRTPSMDFW